MKGQISGFCAHDDDPSDPMRLRECLHALYFIYLFMVYLTELSVTQDRHRRLWM